MLRAVFTNSQMNERRREEDERMKTCERPDQLLGPPVPSPFTDVLYSAERGVTQAAKLRTSIECVNIGKTPGRNLSSLVIRAQKK